MGLILIDLSLNHASPVARRICSYKATKNKNRYDDELGNNGHDASHRSSFTQNVRQFLTLNHPLLKSQSNSMVHTIFWLLSVSESESWLMSSIKVT